MSNQLSTLSPIVFIQDGKAITSSIDVANYFGKLHKDVIRKIQSIECSEEFNERNFAPVGYLDNKGEKRPAYQMTKDGFMFLVMGFTGKKAAQFKEAYIKAFNEMEKALTGQLIPILPSRTIEVSLTNLTALTNDVLWMRKIFSDFKLTEALRALGANDLACKLDGRIHNMMLGVSLLNKDNILSSPTNPS